MSLTTVGYRKVINQLKITQPVNDGTEISDLEEVGKNGDQQQIIR